MTRKGPVLEVFPKSADRKGMDIRHALGSILPTNLLRKDPVDRAIKSENATDRDGNGQMPQGEGEQQKPPMSDEQLQKAMDHLKSLPVVKENNLSLELVTLEGKRFVLLKEPSGKLIRRIPEAELWTLQVVTENKKGQLLRKTA